VEIIVEVGTEEQQNLIKEELSLVEVVIEKYSCTDKLLKIIVPQDFDAKINEIKETTSYKSSREIQYAIAKTLSTNNGRILVISPHIYTIDYDSQTRALTYIHETLHIINEDGLPEISSVKHSERQFFYNLLIMFDEYYVNRKSIELCNNIFPSKSRMYKKHIISELKGHLKALKNNFLYNKIKEEIAKFRIHRNIKLFSNDSNDYYDQVIKAIAYAFAYIDADPKFRRAEQYICNTPFVNSNTLSLIEMFRSLYVADNFENLSRAIPTMIIFYEHLGIKTEDAIGGYYVQILDI